MRNPNMTAQQAIEAFLADLKPRQCACGAPTGSVALDTCEACGGAPVQSRDETRARRAVRDMHALAVDSYARARMDAQGAQEGSDAR